MGVGGSHGSIGNVGNIGNKSLDSATIPKVHSRLPFWELFKLLTEFLEMSYEERIQAISNRVQAHMQAGSILGLTLVPQDEDYLYKTLQSIARKSLDRNEFHMHNTNSLKQSR